ncbi:MAG: hypothetical protein ACK5MV_04265 [Aminipila sp.]
MGNTNFNCDKNSVIQQQLQVQAEISISPVVEHGTPKLFCMDSKIIPNCNYRNKYCNNYNCPYYGNCYDLCYFNNCHPNSSEEYNYTLCQTICVEIPIFLDAEVNIDKGISCCCEPKIKSTNNVNKGCL